jgi:hypothetical protein
MVLETRASLDIVTIIWLAADHQVNVARPVWLTRFDLASVATDVDSLVHQSVNMGQTDSGAKHLCNLFQF